MIEQLKVLAATLVVVGVVVSFINLKYSPHTLLLESSPKRPAWVQWLGWFIISAAAVLYIVVDFVASRLT